MIRLLLDENLPRKLKYRFGEGYDVTTVPDERWQSLQNGDLLRAMQQANIQYLITADKKMSYQQNYQRWGVSLIVLNSPDNQYETLLPFVEKIKALFTSGQVQSYNWLNLER